MIVRVVTIVFEFPNEEEVNNYSEELFNKTRWTIAHLPGYHSAHEYVGSSVKFAKDMEWGKN
jgi:hypothetical protein